MAKKTREIICASPSPVPSPSRGEGYFGAPLLRGGPACPVGRDEGEGDFSCSFSTCFNKYQLILTVFVVITMSSFILSGCGYSLHRHAELPFHEIRIGEIESKSYEPKLQDMLHRALTDEFLKQGIRISPSATLRLTGVVRSFSMVGIAEKADVITEYQINLSADFRVTENGQVVKEFSNTGLPYIVNVTGSDSFGVLIANKEVAQRKAMRDLAAQVVAALIYQ